MATVVGVCNLALQNLKVSRRISSLTQQNSKEASALDECYDEVRDRLLACHDWNFATRRVELGRESTTPTTGWDYQYTLPSDFIRKISLWDNDDEVGKIEYEIADGKVLTDATAVYLKYVRRVTDPNTMTPLFRAALSKALAVQICMNMTNNRSLRFDLNTEYNDEDLPEAKAADSFEEMPQSFPESEWVSCRYGSDHDDTTPAEPT